MHERLSNERGAAMVLVLGVLAVLAVLAMVVMVIVTTEKRNSLAEYSNNRSFYSADAAGEAGVAWIRRLPSPSLVDSLSRVSVAQGYTTLSKDHHYRYDVKFVRRQVRPGWSVEYNDYEYTVQATGVSVQKAEAAIELAATRVFREGY